MIGMPMADNRQKRLLGKRLRILAKTRCGNSQIEQQRAAFPNDQIGICSRFAKCKIRAEAVVGNQVSICMMAKWSFSKSAGGF